MFSKIKKFNLQLYVFLVLFNNFSALTLLNDTTSFNTGLISFSSLIFCLNKILFILFIFLETIASYLDAFGLNINFLKLVFVNPQKLNFNYNFYILFEYINYFLYFLLNVFFLIFFKKIILIINFIIKNKIKFILLIALFFFISIFFITLSNSKFVSKYRERFINKILFYSEENLIRYDNWYLVLKYSLKYDDDISMIPDLDFGKIYENYSNVNNVYIIINESYPNFKDTNVKNLLLEDLINNLDDFTIQNFKKNWSKNYGTLGAEITFFCTYEKLADDFMKLDLLSFVKKNDCWIKKFIQKDTNRVFIHTYKEFFNDRKKYRSFFDEAYFFDDLQKYKLKICDGMYIAVCDDEIINKIFPSYQKNNKSNFIVFLTVNTHIPLIPLKNKLPICDIYPVNQNEQFCASFNQQSIINISINRFIKNLTQNDLLIFFSDTPPIFSVRDRKFFEDYIDVFVFKKK
jgi:hypothetical protein